jgi:hypothetical protein
MLTIASNQSLNEPLTQGTREIRVILYAKEPSYVPRLDTRVNPSDFAGAPPVA